LTNLGWVNHIVMTRVARGTGMERDIRYTLQMKIKLASLLAEIIVMIHGAREIGTERDMKHTSRVLFKKKRLLKNSMILLKEIYIHTVMTRDVRQTGMERDIDRILQTIQILIVLNIREGTKRILVLLPLECTFTMIE
jgi:hypothetical protein